MAFVEVEKVPFVVADSNVEHTIVKLTMNRPEALNALNSEVLASLETTLQSLTADKSVRCVILTGAGEKSFVAGADIKEMSEYTQEQAYAFGRRGQKIFSMLEEAPFATIAAVNGFALGGGLELALSCDFIYASENAKFGLPEVTLGLIPGFGGTVRLSRVVGINRAREMTLTGDMLDSATAMQVGLVNKVVPLSDLMKTALTTAEKIAARGPVAVKMAKQSILKTWGTQNGMEIEAQCFSHLFETQDVREGTSAFLNKSKPKFSGK